MVLLKSFFKCETYPGVSMPTENATCMAQLHFRCYNKLKLELGPNISLTRGMITNCSQNCMKPV